MQDLVSQISASHSGMFAVVEGCYASEASLIQQVDINHDKIQSFFEQPHSMLFLLFVANIVLNASFCDSKLVR